MSKMNDMDMTIEELRNAAAAINDVANWLAHQFSSGAQHQKENIAATTEGKSKPALTLEEVRAVLADKSRAGHTAEIRELGLSTLFQTNFFRLFSRYCTGV